MAIGFGAGSDMHKAVNKQTADRKSGKRSLKESAELTKSSGGKALKFEHQATPEMLNAIRQRKQQENKRNLIIAVSVFVIAGIFVAVIVSSL